ncbi:hypothetical protein MHYP_G00019030 [Metynnis hypsauchen]
MPAVSAVFAGDAWWLEDDKEMEPQEAGLCRVELRPRSQSPFSHFRSRTAYLRKSVSVDGQLGVSEYDSTHTEGRSSRITKGKLKRKFPVSDGQLSRPDDSSLFREGLEKSLSS